MDNLKVPPHSLEAERAVLGGMLISPESLSLVDLSAEDFYHADHRLIYNAVRQMESTNTPVDIVTLSEHLERTGELETVGGMAYIADLAEHVVTVANIETYARAIKERAELRAGISSGYGIAALGFDGDLEGMRRAMSDSFMAVTGETKNQWTTDEALRATLQQIDDAANGERMGVPWGVGVLDSRYPAGMQPGDLIIVGARPSMGKSAFMMEMAENQSCPVLINSLEMTTQQLTMRRLVREAEIPYSNLAMGKLNDLESQRIARAVEAIQGRQVYINDGGGQTLSDVIRSATQAKQKNDIGLLIIDYLTLISHSLSGKNRTDEVGEISRALKGLAKRLHIPVVALAQLNRNLESRQDKHPIMSDLRDSGEIEQDADVILFLYRDAVYNDVDDTSLEILIEKYRNDSLGVEVAPWDARYMKIERRLRNAA